MVDSYDVAIEAWVESHVRTRNKAPEATGNTLRGLLVHLEPVPSAEETDEVQREMWANWPLEDA